jgi:hypothetical protein
MKIAKIKDYEISKYRPITEFLRLIDNFPNMEKDYETIDLGVFDRKIIKGLQIDNTTCLTLMQTADYINTKKNALRQVWKRHKKDLSEGVDYILKVVQNVPTLFFPLRGVLKLLKWTRSGFANRFYDSIVDYICDSFTPIKKNRYEQFRIMILKRDKFTCVRCGNPCNEVHHIFSQEYSPHLKYDPDNAVCSCYDCHDEITKDGRKRFS